MRFTCFAEGGTGDAFIGMESKRIPYRLAFLDSPPERKGRK
jgi:hypothetical protein